MELLIVKNNHQNYANLKKIAKFMKNVATRSLNLT